MGMMDWFGKRMIRSMSPRERYDFIGMAIKEILSSMSPDEKRELMVRLIPEMSKSMLDGMTPEDRKMVVRELAPTILFQLSSSGALAGIFDMMRPKKE